jgi:hypothetical protein
VTQYFFARLIEANACTRRLKCRREAGVNEIFKFGLPEVVFCFKAVESDLFCGVVVLSLARMTRGLQAFSFSGELR